MNSHKFDNLLAASALVLTVAWVIAYLAGFLLDDGSWPVRLGLLGVGLVLCGVAVVFWSRQANRNRRAAAQYVKTLCRLDPEEHDAEAPPDQLPLLARNHPWHDVAEWLRQTIAEHCRRLREMEHSRRATELRCRRASEQYERIRAILSGLDDPIIAIDDYDELVLANARAEALFKLDAASTEDRALRRLLHCEKLVDLLTDTCHRKSTGSRSDEVEIPDNQGRPTWYRVTARKFSADGAHSADGARSADGVSGGAVAVLRDIADQKVLQKRNAEFVSAVSHEMKTPLAGIKAYVELLADGDAEDEKQQEEFLEVINSQADRLERLVSNLLNLARMEAGVVKVDKKSRSLNELLEEALHVVQPAAEAKRIELAGDLSPMYLAVLVDRDMLLQAAINLLSNAVKYTPDGGRVTLRSRLVDNEVHFEVEDTGVGLSEEDCRRVFEKFYRVKKNKQMASGTGLGLPLAKHIVEDVHGGRIAVRSTQGKGSTFAVALPTAKQMSATLSAV